RLLDAEKDAAGRNGIHTATKGTRDGPPDKPYPATYAHLRNATCDWLRTRAVPPLTQARISPERRETRTRQKQSGPERFPRMRCGVLDRPLARTMTPEQRGAYSLNLPNWRCSARIQRTVPVAERITTVSVSMMSCLKRTPCSIEPEVTPVAENTQ